MFGEFCQVCMLISSGSAPIIGKAGCVQRCLRLVLKQWTEVKLSSQGHSVSKAAQYNSPGRCSRLICQALSALLQASTAALIRMHCAEL